MFVESVTIECSKIIDWSSFHSQFTEVFGFPEFYGSNMNAWIDCMSDLHDPDSGMSQVHCEKGKTIIINLKDAREFKMRCPEQYQAILESSAFVNWRNIDIGEPPVITLSFSS